MSSTSTTTRRPRRSPALQQFLDDFVEANDIPEWLVVAADHNARCKCDRCKEYWKFFGSVEGGYGPFTRSELFGPDSIAPDSEDPNVSSTPIIHNTR